MPTGQVIEEEDGFKKDPISERASKDHFVKCRITRNRKGIRGQAMFDEYFLNFPILWQIFYRGQFPIKEVDYLPRDI